MARDNATTAVTALVSLVILAVVASSLPMSVSVDDPGVTTGELEPRPDEEPPPRVPGTLGLVPWGPLLSLVCIVVGLLALRTVYRMLHRPVGQEVPAGERSDPLDESDHFDESEQPLEEVADAAGTAADRLEDTDAFKNEIYRAWWEMTRALSVPNSRARTSGEFAEAAVQAGMEQQDVADLTRLFEDIRYGDRKPTDADEQRATEVLRRIEDAYRRGRS